MSAPVDRKHAAAQMVAEARELFRSVEAGGRGTVDLGRDERKRRLHLERSPQYADAFPDCLQPAVQLWLRVEDEAGRDVTPAGLNPVYVVGSDCAGKAEEWLAQAARLAVVSAERGS